MCHMRTSINKQHIFSGSSSCTLRAIIENCVLGTLAQRTQQPVMFRHSYVFCRCKGSRRTCGLLNLIKPSQLVGQLWQLKTIICVQTSLQQEIFLISYCYYRVSKCKYFIVDEFLLFFLLVLWFCILMVILVIK